MGELLAVDGLTRSFGGIRALDGLDLRVERGQVVGLIGPNGSGKTTAFNLISGIIAPAAGRVRFLGRDITGQPADRNAALGMARTFQNIRLFTNLSVGDNVAVGCHHRHGAGLAGTLLNWRGTARAEFAIRERTQALLERFGLAEHADRPVGSLSYGDQRRVELCRALATEPSLLLLDEPSAGMNPREKTTLMALIDSLRRELDVGILLVEHDMKIVMGICDRIQVIAQGRMLAAGTPAEIRNDASVIEAYLGHPEGGSVLWLEDVHVERGGLPVLRGVTLEVGRGEIIALVGANGAGKTTTLATISGLVPCRRGRILFEAAPGADRLDLCRLKPAAIVAAGIVHCPEGRQIFGNLSVRENLAVGAFRRSDRAAIGPDLERVQDLFPILRERARQPGTRLSGGEQMMLAIGRALMAKPALLLLDEPSLGLAPKLIDQVFTIIERLRAEGTTILLVEQNAAMALAIADRAYVLETGRIALAGSGPDLAADPAVRDAYLGAA